VDLHRSDTVLARASKNRPNFVPQMESVERNHEAAEAVVKSGSTSPTQNFTVAERKEKKKKETIRECALRARANDAGGKRDAIKRRQEKWGNYAG